MSRRLYTLHSPKQRSFVASVVSQLLKGWRVEIKPPVRTLPQNDAMWGALTSIADQHEHFGISLQPKDWKLVLLDYFWRLKNEELQIVPAIGGKGFVPLSGRSTSDLTKEEMSEFLDLIHATGAEWGVQFHESDQGGAGANNSRAEAA